MFFRSIKRTLIVLAIFALLISGTIVVNGSAVYAQPASKNILFITDGSYGTGYRIDSNLSYLRDALIAEGFGVSELVTGSNLITAGDIEPYDILVFANIWAFPEGRDITAPEVDLFKNFVQNGGGLLLIAENSGIENMNRSVGLISKEFGFELSPAGYGVTVTDLIPHEITTGISSFQVAAGSTFILSGGAMPVAKFADGKPAISVTDFVAGRVVATGDINMFDNQFGNTSLAVNIFKWLAAGADVPVPKPVRSNHELVTLLTNPADGTGVRIPNLNYYLRDPVIWHTDVKNITVWLESEVFDLAQAQQKAKLPAGLKLLKDYNIRLMMKIVYNDGTVVTKEVDNGDIARNIPVLIPIDEFAGISDLGIIYMDTRGNTAILPVAPVMVDGVNYLQFENNHFSEYGVVSGTAQATAQPQPQTYTIQPGDTLSTIAAKLGVTVQSLAAANNISNLDLIYAGKELVIG